MLVHSKRWQYNESTKILQQFDDATDFPATYGPIANVSCNLRSIVEHIGAAREGHYVACARDDRHGWLHDDDSDTPVRVDEQAVLKRSAYLLFLRTQFLSWLTNYNLCNPAAHVGSARKVIRLFISSH